MGFLDSLAQWVLLPEIWVIVAILLIGADIVLGFDFFVFSIGIAALILAGLLFAQKEVWPDHILLFETWEDVGIWFAGLSIGSIGLIRLWLRRRHSAQPDVNQY